MNNFRLSYIQRVKDMMPEAYSKLIPALPQANFKYANEGAGKSSQH